MKTYKWEAIELLCERALGYKRLAWQEKYGPIENWYDMRLNGWATPDGRQMEWHEELPDLGDWEGAGLLIRAMKHQGYDVTLLCYDGACERDVEGYKPHVSVSAVSKGAEDDEGQAVFLAACKCYGVDYHEEVKGE